MDNIKRENYERENPGKTFPEVQALDANELTRLQERMCSLLELPSDSTLQSLVGEMSNRLGPHGNVGTDPNFSIRSTLSANGITPLCNVYINWYQFDEIDKVAFGDLEENFPYFWYPSADDIDIFDESMSWVLSIRHDGLFNLINRRSTNSQE